MVRKDQRPGKLTLALRRLLLKDVAGEGVTRANLAAGGQLKALLRTGMGLHLRHKFVLLKQILSGFPVLVVAGCLGGARVGSAHLKSRRDSVRVRGASARRNATQPPSCPGSPGSAPLTAPSTPRRRHATAPVAHQGCGAWTASNRQFRSRTFRSRAASRSAGCRRPASNRQLSSHRA